MHGDQEKTEGLIAAGRAVHAAVDAVDETIARLSGIHRSDLRCLNLLEHGPLRAGELADRLDLTSGAITSLIDRLEHRGLAVRRPAPDDRRSTVVELTPDAFKEVGERYRLVAESARNAFRKLTEFEHASAVTFLSMYAEALSSADRRLRELESAGD